MAPSEPLNIVVVGGGVAAAECVLALRELAGERVALALVAPEPDFVLRPLRTAEPFSTGHVVRHPVSELAEAVDARLLVDAVTAVAPERHAVRLRSGETVDYDALVLAVGARHRTEFARAITFSGDQRSTVYNGLLADLEERWTSSVAFVVPTGTTWPLPLYELALQTARQTRAMGVSDVAFDLYTPEPAPLAVFGEASSAVVGRLLEEYGVAFRGATAVRVDDEGHLAADGGRLRAQRIVALPTLQGPALAGVPADGEGFLIVDDHGRVAGTDDVYAAGDGTTVPIKQGGVATQLADTIAEHLAQRAGAAVHPRPFRAEMRGRLLVGGGVQPLPPLGDGPAFEPLDSAVKVEGRHLSGWLHSVS